MIDRRAAAVFLATSVLLGGTFVAARGGLEYFPPLLFVALRFDLAAIALAAYVVSTRSRAELLPQTRGDVLGILAAGGVAIGVTNALLFVGQQDATSAVGAIVFSLNPVLTPLFAAILLTDERLSRRGAVGIGLGLLGVALVVDPDPAMILDGGLGTVALFGAAVSAALGAVLIRRTTGGLSSTVRTAWALPVAAALCHGASLAAGESAAAIAWTPAAVVALAYVALFAGALGYLGYFGLLDGHGAIHANLTFYLVPAVATLGGAAFLGEIVQPMALVGFLVIFAGFGVVGSASVDRAALRSTLQSAIGSGLGRARSPSRSRSREDAYGTESD